MDQFVSAIQRNALNYWREAVEPFHQFQWQTFSLLALFGLSTALLLSLLLRYRWVGAKPALESVTVSGTPHSSSSCIRLNPEDHLKYHKVAGASMSDAAKELRTSDLSKYYVVTIVQKKPTKELVYREMRLQAPPVGAAYVQKGTIKLDAKDLAEVRRGNAWESDNNPGATVEGVYDVYIRPVRWFDLRHWLMHPNREARILIWVTLITTIVPTLIQLVFG